MRVIIIGEKEVLETIPEGCTRSMFRNRNLFQQAVYIQPPVLLEPGESGGYGRERNHDHGTDFRISNCLLRGTLLENDERVRQSQSGNGKSH